jgi:membrane-bound lytic murein transglycosylase D
MFNKKLFLLFWVIVGCRLPGFCQSYEIERCELDPVIRQIDSLFYKTFTKDKMYLPQWELEQYIHYPTEKLPRYTDNEIFIRLQSIPAIIPMTYTREVRSFIDYFVFKRREMMTRMLANAQIYFPLFEEVLDRKGLPIELRYLPIIESAFNPNAVSRAGATGLWQLMHGTGKMLGLEINSYVDERRDPARSTEAAATYLKQLYEIYGDWHLVLAAYNSGPGNVNKAIARSGGSRNFWTIMPYLPAETRSYVPIFIAAVYAMHYAEDYFLKPAEPKRELYVVDTILVPGKISLAHIAKTLEIPVEELQFLNPSLRAGIIPFTQNGFPLNLPINYFSLFEARRNEILNDPLMAEQEVVMAMAATPKIVYEKVQKGETIHKIAAKYGCSIAEIKKWNGLKNNHLSAGMKLKIVLAPEPLFNPPPTPAAPQNLPATHTKSPETDSLLATADTTPKAFYTETRKIYEPVYATHIVKQGETLSKIAQRYRTSVNDLIQLNKLRSSSLKVGQKLQIKTGEKVTYAQVQVPIEKTEEECKCIRYVVRPGDTLWSITQKYEGLTIQKLKEENEFIRQRPIKVGDVLKITL